MVGKTIVPSLKLTAILHLKIGRNAPKGNKYSIQSINFQVEKLLLVLGSEKQPGNSGEHSGPFFWTLNKRPKKKSLLWSDLGNVWGIITVTAWINPNQTMDLEHWPKTTIVDKFLKQTPYRNPRWLDTWLLFLPYLDSCNRSILTSKCIWILEVFFKRGLVLWR